MAYEITMLGDAILDLNWVTKGAKRVKFNYNCHDKSKSLFDAYEKLYKDEETESILYNNADIDKLFDCLLKPFVSVNNIFLEDSFFDNVDIGKVKSALTEARFILKELLGCEVNIVYDFKKHNDPIKRNISIYIDKIYKTLNEVESTVNPLEYTLEPSEFYKFRNNNGVVVSIVVPVQFLRDMLYFDYSEVDTISPSHVSPRDILTLGSTNRKINMVIARKMWTVNFINNFRISLYNENRRESIYAALYLYIKLCIDEYDRIPNSNLIKITDEEIIKRNKNILKPILDSDLPIANELKVIFMLLISYSLSKIHPLEIINEFCDADVKELQELGAQLGISAKWINNPHYSTYDSRYYMLNEDKDEYIANALVTSLSMKRLIPWILVSVISQRNQDRKLMAMKFFEDLRNKHFSFNTSEIFANTQALIDSFSRDMKFIEKMGNNIVDRFLNAIHHYWNNEDGMKKILDADNIEEVIENEQTDDSN